MDRKDFERWLSKAYPQMLRDASWHDNEQRYTVLSSAQILWEAWQVAAADEIERLHAENESLRKDAERYRWLRDNYLPVRHINTCHEMTNGGYVFWKIAVLGDVLSFDHKSKDAAIDAAIREQKP